MLVCNVSLRPPRMAIAAGLNEIATADDALGTSNVVFATLVDDPASTADTVDAYLGEIMLEAASAADVVSSGSDYAAAIDEAGTASEFISGSIAAAATMTTTSVAGPLFVFDTTFPSSKLTVINVGN